MRDARAFRKPFGSGEWQLYNLREDPGEINDLSAEYPQRVEEMAALWEQYRDENGVLDIAFDLLGGGEEGR